MKTTKIWANLAVANLQKTDNFYKQLGFKYNNLSQSKELTSFMVGIDDFIIHFFLKEILETNLHIQMGDPKQGSEVIFSLAAESKEGVNEWLKVVEKTGGTIFSPPATIGKGYSFGFSDPDGHKFNVLYWPK